jgi:hypothetical protein
VDCNEDFEITPTLGVKGKIDFSLSYIGGDNEMIKKMPGGDKKDMLSSISDKDYF